MVSSPAQVSQDACCMQETSIIFFAVRKDAGDCFLLLSSQKGVCHVSKEVSWDGSMSVMRLISCGH